MWIEIALACMWCFTLGAWIGYEIGMQRKLRAGTIKVDELLIARYLHANGLTVVAQSLRHAVEPRSK